MRRKVRPFLSRVIEGQSGQVLPWVALLSVMFLGMAGLSLDLGTVYVAQRQLQATTDAAALAGAQAMWVSGATSTSVQTMVQTYSSVAGNDNAGGLSNVTLVSVNLACVASLQTSGVPCVGPGTTNALQVKQTAVVPTMFVRMLGLFGVNAPATFTVGALSTASIKGGVNAAYNVALVLDSTGTMSTKDTTCGSKGTRLSCALQGAQELLSLLSPCSTGTAGSSSNCKAFDTVSVFTFPGVVASSASNDTTCPTTSVTTAQYYAPAAPTGSTAPYTWGTYTAPSGSSATYQIVGYSDSYVSNYTQGGTLSTSGAGAAVGGSSNSNGTTTCGGLVPPSGNNGDNYQGTYYAGAILAAADSLYTQWNSNQNSYNALIILSDGDASSCYKNTSTGANNYNTCEDQGQSGGVNGDQMSSAFSSSTGSYPSYMDQCQQGLEAANYAKTIPHTTVFTISYGSPSSGCATDTSNDPALVSAGVGSLKGISPCQALLDMASSSADFFTDSDSSNPSACTGNSTTTLTTAEIFKIIWLNATSARLQPNSVFPSS